MTGNNVDPFPWGDETDDYLREKHKEGWSSQEMADGMYRQFGRYLTRNAVIGRRRRLGLIGGAKTALNQVFAAKRNREKQKVEGKGPAPFVLVNDPEPAMPKPPRDDVIDRIDGRPLEPTARPWETRQFGECCWPAEVDGVTYSCCRRVVNWQFGWCEKHERIGCTPRDKKRNLPADKYIRTLRRYVT